MQPESNRGRVLIVDDDAPIARFCSTVLERAGHDCATAQTTAEARTLVVGKPPHVVLCDINLAGESGMEFARELRARDPGIAVVMITGSDDEATVDAALELGAYGYVVKPFTASELGIAVLNALRRRSLELESRKRHDLLEAAVHTQTAALRETIDSLRKAEEDSRRAQVETIRRLAAAVEFRDHDTGRHIERMSRLTEQLALEAGLGRERAELLRLASLLHDVGKIGIPDSILLKRGPLNRSERAVMRRHAEIGHAMLVGSGIELLDVAASIAWTHHEHFDGRGYPRGLRADEIPIEGRIVAITDVFDALTSPRAYREAYPIEQVVELMKQGRGSHFDAELLDLFLERVARQNTRNGSGTIRPRSRRFGAVASAVALLKTLLFWCSR